MRFLLLIAATFPLLAQNPAPQQHAETGHHQTPTANPTDKDSTAAPNVRRESIGSPHGNNNSPQEKQGSNQQGQNWWKRPSITDWIIAGLTFFYVLINIFILAALKG